MTANFNCLGLTWGRWSCAQTSWWEARPCWSRWPCWARSRSPWTSRTRSCPRGPLQCSRAGTLSPRWRGKMRKMKKTSWWEVTLCSSLLRSVSLSFPCWWLYHHHSHPFPKHQSFSMMETVSNLEHANKTQKQTNYTGKHKNRQNYYISLTLT